ncbi:MAG: uracil-DNA glycosylase family protein, partial [Methyloceanibacter sp.]
LGCLHHQRSEAFQERAARQAAHPQKPDTREIDLCRFWLDNEMEIVRPRVVVALGATAARGLMRRAMTINANRGRLIALAGGGQAVITVHPSYLLRLQEERDKRREFDLLVKDLRLAGQAAHTVA